MRITKFDVVARAISGAILVLVAFLAGVQAMGASPDVFTRPYGKVLAILGLAVVAYVALDRDFYVPIMGPTIMPTSTFATGVPKATYVATTIDCPSDAVSVVYWAATPSAATFESEQSAFVGFTNAGVVPVVGGRATLRLNCPSPFKLLGWISEGRRVFYRYVYADGRVSSVSSMPIANCP